MSLTTFSKTVLLLNKTHHFKLFCTASLLLFLLSGCSSINIFGIGEEEGKYNVPVNELIVTGMDEYNVGKYYLAVKYFDKILDRYPFSPEASLAELKAADSHYYMGHYIEAHMLYSEFEDRHPTNEAIPYVMYQKGMSNYKRIDRIDRDVTGAIDAIQNFSQLLRAFPNSPYTQEAKARIRASNEFLVNHEYYVVKFYLRTEKYSQAEARLKYLVNMYPDSSITPQATELLAQIEAGNPPRSNLSSYFPDFTLPSWTFFSSESDAPEKIEIPEEKQ